MDNPLVVDDWVVYTFLILVSLPIVALVLNFVGDRFKLKVFTGIANAGCLIWVIVVFLMVLALSIKH